MNTKREEFRKKNLKDWERVINEIFPNGVPDYYTWKTQAEIINVLNKLGSIPALNHTFMPSGGGLDLTGAEPSHERNCIELVYGGVADIIKPKTLAFYYLGGNYEWAYFRLETKELEPSGVYESYSDDSMYEELTEIAPNQYVDRSAWEYNDYNGYPLPEGSRTVTRYFKGTFLIAAKASTYNWIPATYDGRHNKVSNEQFKELMLYIKEHVDINSL